MSSGARIVPSISLSVTPVFSEYHRCFRRLLHLGQLRPLRPFLVRARAFFGIGLLCVVAMLVLGIFSLTDWWVAIVFALTGLGLAFGAIPTIIYFGARRQWQATPEIREPRTYTFDGAGVQVDAASFQQFARWSEIAAVERVADQFVLSVGNHRFYFIPVRAFGTDEEMASFCSLVESKVSGCRL
jgi:hypothetical protein